VSVLPGITFTGLAQVTPSLLGQITISSASLQVSRARATLQGDAPASVSGGFRSVGHEHAARGPLLLQVLELEAVLDVVPVEGGAVDETVAPPAPPTVSPVHAARASTTVSRDVA
jgi:hypothetical protein